ncbi:MAG: protein translocase subunit SecF, partial [Halobacteria archaeon]|nr:protein translocase subunit SecF [Halobacteria archaeon]
MINVEDIDHSEYSNIQLLAIPTLLLVLTFAIVGATFVLTGSPVNLGFQFAGGASVQINSDKSIDQIRQEFASINNAPAPDNVRSTADGFVIRYKGVSDSQINALTDYVNSNYDNASISTVSPAYGQSLLQQSIGAVVFAFLIMSITIFAFFRTFVPSIAVVLSAFSDMVVPLGVMNLLGIDVSLATIPAILLLIGYSIDS